MTSECGKVRQSLIEVGLERSTEPVREHLAQCADCTRFGEKLALAEGLLSDAGATVEPDAGFTARVRMALPSNSGNFGTMGWAAVRLLPATLALALVLTGWSLLMTQSPESLLIESPSESLLTWVLDTDGGRE